MSDITTFTASGHGREWHLLLNHHGNTDSFRIVGIYGSALLKDCQREAMRTGRFHHTVRHPEKPTLFALLVLEGEPSPEYARLGVQDPRD